jgi:NDP-sugar pyrophosphorylase family protein
MVPIFGRPFLAYQAEQLRDQRFERTLLLLGALRHIIETTSRMALEIILAGRHLKGS